MKRLLFIFVLSSLLIILFLLIRCKEHSCDFHTTGKIICKEYIEGDPYWKQYTINPYIRLLPVDEQYVDEQYNVYIDIGFDTLCVNDKQLYKCVNINSIVNVVYKETYRRGRVINHDILYIGNIYRKNRIIDCSIILSSL